MYGVAAVRLRSAHRKVMEESGEKQSAEAEGENVLFECVCVCVAA